MEGLPFSIPSTGTLPEGALTMKKFTKLSKLTLNRETLRLLDLNEARAVVGGLTGPDSHCTTRLDCPTGRSECRAC
jgi:hypothetical protein